MKDKTLRYPIFNHFTHHMRNQNIFQNIILYIFHPSPLLNKIKFYGTNFGLIQNGYETFRKVMSPLQNHVAKSSGFLWKLLLFIVKIFYNLLYNPICGLLRIVCYWESINSSS